MNGYSEEKLQELLKPIVSLISKSEKAQQKLTEGIWQYTMLQNNLKALRYAFKLMSKNASDVDNFTKDDLQNALESLVSMISKTEKARAKFQPKTSQYTLLRNRHNALCVAKKLIQEELDKGGN